MLKISIWLVSKDKLHLDDAMGILERQHGGVEIISFSAGEGIAKIDGDAADVILVAGAREFGMSKVVRTARKFSLPEEKLLCDWIACIPGFTLENYRKLQRSCLSIFSMNCFGGILSNTLGLPFRSPFVNLFMSSEDFIEFLHAPRVLIEEQPTYQGQKLTGSGKGGFPVAALGNISLNMMHYKTVEESFDAWNKRKARINWFNLFVTMFTDSEEILEQFDALPFGKKVCFVPFKSDSDSAWYIDPNVLKQDLRFSEKVNQFARGNPFYYDVFDMLLYGKKTQLIDM